MLIFLFGNGSLGTVGAEYSQESSGTKHLATEDWGRQMGKETRKATDHFRTCADAKILLRFIRDRTQQTVSAFSTH